MKKVSEYITVILNCLTSNYKLLILLAFVSAFSDEINSTGISKHLQHTYDEETQQGEVITYISLSISGSTALKLWEIDRH